MDIDNNEQALMTMLSETMEDKKKALSELDVVGVLPLKNKVLFPDVLMPVTVNRAKSVALVRQTYEENKPLAVFTQKEESVGEPQVDDLYRYGVAARIVRVIPIGNDMAFIIIQGWFPIYLDELVDRNPYLTARVSIREEDDSDKDTPEFATMAASIKSSAMKLFEMMENMPPEGLVGLRAITYPSMVVNYIAANYPMPIAERQKLLEMSSIKDRAASVVTLLNKEEEQLTVQQDIQKKAQEEVAKNQREYFLHQQLHAIRKELGETSEKDVMSLRERAKQKQWSQEVANVFEEEVKKLERIEMRSSEYSTQLNYLETMLSLPWNEYTEDDLDIRHAQQVLDEDHFGMEEAKERILEHLAVLRQVHAAQQSSPTADKHKTPILCLYGPPGVGKTSLGRSVAKALNRKYARISLGGLHDEAEIRGHRKTYVAAMPGRIVESLKKVKTSNPVFVLDEIDKVSNDFRGDPTSALLEVLDPEQNSTFHDNYLDIPYDLSKVLFIATANSLQNIPRPLLDRMELIEMTGYLQEEKEQICRKHLIPKELEAHGLKADELVFSDAAIRTLIDEYTRESGVRELDRQVQSVIRKFIKKKALEDGPSGHTLEPEEIRTFLGKPKYSRDRYETNTYTGVVTGLAWTQVGGEILFIETSLHPAKTPTLTLTGNLGDVMKESATIALGYIRAHAGDFGIQQKLIDTRSVHLHVPEGAIPKDGPSAGITMTTAMISAFTGRLVRERVAMTGEMTLRGKVLPVGGIKEKILAAKRAGITDIVLCHENEKDVNEIKPEYVSGLHFHYVHDIHEVVDFALV